MIPTIDATRVVSSKNCDRHVRKLPPVADEGQINTRGSAAGLHALYEIVSQHPECKRIVDNCGFGGIFLVDYPGSADSRLVSAITERWWYTTHTFHAPRFEIGFTPWDFTMLTCIAVGSGTLIDLIDFSSKDWAEFGHIYTDFLLPWVKPPKKKDRDNTVEEEQQTGPEVNREGYYVVTDDETRDYVRNALTRKSGIKLSLIRQYILTWKKTPLDQWEDSDVKNVARMFLMWVIGNVLFPNKNDVALLSWLRLLVDLEKVNTYDWGQAIMGRLYSALDNAVTHKKSGELECFWYILLPWFWSYIPVLKPNTDEGQGNPDFFPALKLCDKGHMKKGTGSQRNTGPHSLVLARNHLDSLDPIGITWLPWNRSSYYGIGDVANARRLSVQRCSFYDPIDREYFLYLGERCLRQTQGKVAIPMDPPPKLSGTSEEMGNYVGGGHNTLHYCETTEDEFYVWWKSHSIGPYLPTVVHAGNVYVARVEPPIRDQPSLTQSTYVPEYISTLHPQFPIEEPPYAVICGNDGRAMKRMLGEEYMKEVHQYDASVGTAEQWCKYSQFLADKNAALNSYMYDHTSDLTIKWRDLLALVQFVGS